MCSAASLLLYKIDGNDEHLQQAMDASIRAHELDPHWPWPLLQLANIIRSTEVSPEMGQRLSVMLSSESTSGQDLDFTLKLRATELAIENTEFEKQVLGGRTRVFVLNDQHRLLSSSIVLKPTTSVQAERERDAAISLGEYLKGLGLEEECRVPIPISIKQIGSGKAIYAMERVEGQTLALGLIDFIAHNEKAKVLEYFRLSVRFLAAYHAWQFKPDVEKRKFGGIKQEVSEVASIMGLEAKIGREMLALADSCLPHSLPLVAKKDAHPENWLMTQSGIVMLDLESTGFRPICYEVAQLLDDYGVLDVSEEGLQTRVSLTKQYLTDLAEFGAPIAIDDHVIENLYAVSWALRCGFGIGYCRRHSQSRTSTARMRLVERVRHYEVSLQFLCEKFNGTAIEALARVINETQPSIA